MRAPDVTSMRKGVTLLPASAVSINILDTNASIFTIASAAAGFSSLFFLIPIGLLVQVIALKLL